MRIGLVVAGCLLLAGCGPDPEAVRANMLAKQNVRIDGLVYQTSASGGIETAAESFFWTHKHGPSSDSVEIVYQPEFGILPGDDPGGVVLLRLKWPEEDLKTTNWDHVTPDELLEKANVEVTSGNGLDTVSANCPDGTKYSWRSFCARARLASAVYVLSAKKSPYVVVRRGGVDQNVNPDDIRN